jgi:hypothetical protein
MGKQELPTDCCQLSSLLLPLSPSSSPPSEGGEGKESLKFIGGPGCVKPEKWDRGPESGIWNRSGGREQ